MFGLEIFKFENGYALNCYPDAVIWDIPGIVGTIKIFDIS